MGRTLGVTQVSDNAELHQLRREVLELRIQNVRLLQMVEGSGQLGWSGSYIHEPTGVRVYVSTKGDLT